MHNTSDWRSFADRLTKLVNFEGQQNYLDEAFFFMNEHVAVDSCAVFAVSADKTTGANHICTFGKLDSKLADMLAEDYTQTGFKNDPMVQTALLSPKSRVRRLPKTYYSQAYRSQFFDIAGLVDKITSIHTTRNTLYIASFYRLEATGQFEQKDFKDLERIAAIIGRSVLRHRTIMGSSQFSTQRQADEMDKEFVQKISDLVHDGTQIFGTLSAREKDVAKYSLTGMQEKEIANELGISLGTVTTYRKRLYAKLNIVSKAQLFRLAIIALL